MTALANRMKLYERAAAHHFAPRTPVIVRVDGRAFHSFTRHCDRPFDTRIVNSMVHAARAAAADMQGFVVGYVQSDEASFMLTDLSSLEAQPWFDNDVAKIVSIAASLMTAHFNYIYDSSGHVALFDSRAFSLPLDDAPNYFVWRMNDWQRNSLQMLARANFSHRQLHQKKASDIHEMLHSKGLNWAHLDANLRNGAVITRAGVVVPEERWTYKEWNEQIVAGLTVAVEAVTE
jgi:tRNA(His) guanylyltransferase